MNKSFIVKAGQSAPPKGGSCGGWSVGLAVFLWSALALPGAILTLTPEAPNLNVPSQETEVIVNAAGIPEWQVKVPKGQVASFRFDPVRVLVDISTPRENKGVITIRLPDGVHAELGAASAARFDWFKDQTYYFSGSGKVSAKSQTGIASVLSSYFLPLTGGLLEKDAGENSPKRRSPLVRVHLLSDAGKEMLVRVEKEEVRIKNGEVRRITHPNGSILELSRDEKLKRLRWKVIKGYFEFDIPETECWRAYTVTDQEGGLRHEAGQKGADVLNLSPESIVQPNENIFADLHHQVTAAVHRRADFRYRQHEDCAHYEGSSTGGPVDLSRPVLPGADQPGGLSGGSTQTAGLKESFLWSLTIPDGGAVLVGLNDGKQLVDFATGAGNATALLLRMADGGRAEIGADSKARLDLFKDNTYYLAGSGSVNAVNASGQKFALGPLQPPMTGGPMLTTTDASGNTQITQLSPVTPVKVVGNLGSELVVQVGSQQVTVPVDGTRTVTLANGSEIKLTQSSGTRTLVWEADKGYFQIKVDGTGRWQADGLTDQSASMQWSAPQSTDQPGQIDLRNLSSGGPVLVNLADRTYAAVTPQATFQYSQGIGSQFTASAVGGEVNLVNLRPSLLPGDGALPAGLLEPFVWSLRIPGGDTVLVGLNDGKQLVDFTTGAGNATVLLLRMADGGRAEIGVDSKARLDLLKDNTYYLAGSGNVNAVNADGQKFVLGPLQPPMTGGPLLTTTDANGNTQITQLSPVTPVKVVGNLGDELIVQVGSQQVTVPVDGTRTVTLANGSEIKLTQSSGTRTLVWEADKGYFQIKVDGTGRWQADGLTDQSASMQWSAPQPTGQPGQIDIQNLSGDRPLLVGIGNRNFAEVLPEATLLYSQGNGSQFTASAVGGEVVLYNTRTGTETTLLPSDPAIRGGGLTSGEGGVNWQSITVSGDEQTLMRARGEGGDIALRNEEDQKLNAFNGDEFTVGAPLRGILNMESTSGDHAIDFKALQGWTIYIPEGQVLTFEMDLRNGIVNATASGDNTSGIRIVTGDGFNIQVNPEDTISFRLKPVPPPGGGLIRELVIIPPIVQPPVTVVR